MDIRFVAKDPYQSIRSSRRESSLADHFLFRPIFGQTSLDHQELFGLWINDSRVETLPIALFASLFLFYYLHLLVYLIVSYRLVLRKKDDGLNPEVFKFLQLLFIGLVLIWAAYVFNLFDEVIPYIAGPILYSIVAESFCVEMIA